MLRLRPPLVDVGQAGPLHPLWVRDTPMKDVALPGMPEPSMTGVMPATRSAGQRLTERQAQDIREGRHPLTRSMLHAHADQGARSGDSATLLFRCGSCVHRVLLRYHDRTYPKCDLSEMTHGTATDVRAWWPACPSWEIVP